MIKQLVAPLKKINKYGLAAFLIPFLIMMACYGMIGIFLGTDRSILASDAYSQFSNFHASFNNVLHGKQNLFYTWNATLGLNYYALISYYLGGIFTPLVFFFDKSLMPDALYVLTLLKIGCASLAFWFYAKETFKVNPWSHVSLAVSYSLMSFITAHSELIMWLDTFIYLPLIFLGINRVMDQRRPLLLFISYFLLFISNFYFGFMVGILSFLYFWARTSTNWSRYKYNIHHYLITSLLAGLASMVMILPTFLDLRSNGEKLTEITKLKTSATGVWDLLVKNMVGVYDTTKYGSIPFIYIGLFPLVLCLFYFVSKKIPRRNKLAYGSIFAIIIASFYFVPLNLFWHGMHAPNMFLFRYSFTFSFLVIMLAGYALEKVSKQDSLLVASIIVILIGAFTMAFAVRGADHYDYLKDVNFIVTVLFLLLYLIGFVLYQFSSKRGGKPKIQLEKTHFAILLLVLISFEAVINTNGTLNGILDDWRYASRSLYVDPYKDYQDGIETVKQNEESDFFRIETLAPVSANDSLNYGFSGISLFSSIRNRNTTSLLNDLGFRSRGTGLNIRYQNNTLLMDSLFGIKYNHVENNLDKFGFNLDYQNDTYKMFKNDYALPLGMMTNQDLYKVNFPTNNNLAAQKNLINQLAQTNLDFYQTVMPITVGSTNVTTTKNGGNVTYTEIKGEVGKDVTWEITVPAGKQAYLSLFPTNFSELNSSTAELTVNGQRQKTQVDISGQYYNLGYYEKETKVSFTVSFVGTDKISLINPPVILLDIPAFETAVRNIQNEGVDFKVSGRKAFAEINATTDDAVVMTTIPFDQGWKAYLDGKKVPIKAFRDGLMTIPVPSGKHQLKLVFFPAGLKLGIFLFISSSVAFGFYLYYININNDLISERTRRQRRRKRKV